MKRVELESDVVVGLSIHARTNLFQSPIFTKEDREKRWRVVGPSDSSPDNMSRQSAYHSQGAENLGGFPTPTPPAALVTPGPMGVSQSPSTASPPAPPPPSRPPQQHSSTTHERRHRSSGRRHRGRSPERNRQAPHGFGGEQQERAPPTFSALSPETQRLFSDQRVFQRIPQQQIFPTSSPTSFGPVGQSYPPGQGHSTALEADVFGRPLVAEAPRMLRMERVLGANTGTGLILQQQFPGFPAIQPAPVQSQDYGSIPQTSIAFSGAQGFPMAPWPATSGIDMNSTAAAAAASNFQQLPPGHHRPPDQPTPEWRVPAPFPQAMDPQAGQGRLA